MAEGYEPIPYEGHRQLLWSNPHPGNWGTDDIVLSSSDYSVLEVVFAYVNDSTAAKIHQYFTKGYNILLFISNVDSIASNCFIMSRLLVRKSDTTYTPQLGMIIRWGGQPESGQNYFMIPREIYGIK